MADRADSRHRAFIGSFTSAGGRGITTAALDPDSGALAVRSHTDAVADPSFLAVDPARPLLYAVSETDPGAVAALSTADPAQPRLLAEPAPVDGAGPTHVTLAAGAVWTADYVSGNVSALPLDGAGVPLPPARTHQHRGSGPDKERQEGPHAHAVVPDPSGRWLLSTDLGTDSVWILDLRGAPGDALRPHGEVPLRPGTGPRHLAFASPDRALIVNELDSTVTSCRWDADGGTLEPVEETRVLPAGTPGGDNFPSALVISPDGRFAWVANRGDDSIAVLALDTAGRAELRGTVPCGGHWPRDLAVHPSGRLLYAANERSGDVTWFTVDEATGTPRRAGSLAAPAASCVVFG